MSAAAMPAPRPVLSGKDTAEEAALCRRVTDGRFRLADRRQALADLLQARHDAGRNRVAFDVVDYMMTARRDGVADTWQLLEGVEALCLAVLELGFPQAEWWKEVSR